MTSPQSCSNCWHREVQVERGKPDVTLCRPSRRVVDRGDLCERWQQGVPPEATYSQPAQPQRVQIGPLDV